VQGPPSYKAASSPIANVIPKAMVSTPTATQALASRAPTYTPQQYTPGIASYGIGAATQVSANPLSGIPTQYLPNLTTAPLAAGVDFSAMGGSAPQARAVSIMPYAQAAMDMLDYAGQERVAAAREGEIARGMGRSGVALGVEDRVNYETDLAKAAEYADYSARQGEIDTQISIANQQAKSAFQQLQEQSRQYAAALQQERSLADQQAKIEMAGLQTQWASVLADISFQREELNANLRQTQEQMMRAANEFDRSLEAENFFSQQQVNFNYAGLNEQARATNLSSDYNWASLAQQSEAAQNDYAYNMANLAAQTGQAGTDWTDIVNNANDAFYKADAAGYDPYASTQAQLDVIAPGWRENPDMVKLYTDSSPSAQNPFNFSYL